MANDLQPLPNAGAAWLPDLKQPNATWLAARVETFLGQYWHEADDMKLELVTSDWMRSLRSFPQQAVEWACAEWLDTQPRHRPRPGDVAALCRQWVARQSEAGRRDALRGAALSETQEQVVQWAVDTLRLTRNDAVDAVRQIARKVFPSWVPESEAQRCVYCVRHHPRCQAPVEQPKQKRRWAE